MILILKYTSGPEKLSGFRKTGPWLLTRGLKHRELSELTFCLVDKRWVLKRGGHSGTFDCIKPLEGNCSVYDI